MRTFVIAEAGSAGGASLPRMVDLIGMAANAGADAVKFQWTSDPKRMAKQRGVDGNAYTLLAWPSEWLSTLAANAKARSLEFMCSVFLSDDIATVEPFVSRFKAASIEAADPAFLQRHCAYNKPIIISTGACDQRAVSTICAFRSRHPNVSVLHCISGYPTPLAEVNLAVIRRYGLDGFSDHTADVRTGGLAVAAGARIIEVHFRHPDTDAANPDYKHSLDCKNLYYYIESIRHAETVLGNGYRQPQPSETVCVKIREGMTT